MGHLPSGSRLPPWKWQLVALMFLATMINYMDRQTLGSVQKPFLAEFNITEKEYGLVEFAFGVSFATTQLVAGAMADRMSIRWLYAGALLLWSAAGAACGMVNTLGLFIVCRIVLGFGESFNWPCAVAAVRRVFPLDSRSFANGIFHGGASIGAILTPLVVLALVGPPPEFHNWRHVFVVVGAGGALWVVAWLWFVRGERAAAIDTPPREEGPPQPLWDVLWDVRLLLVVLIGVCVNICWHFFRTWLPLIFDREYQFDARTIQWFLAGFYISADLGGVVAGLATRRLIRQGLHSVRARQVVMFGTAAVCLVAGLSAIVAPAKVAVPLFFLVGAGAMGGFPNYFALSQETSARHTAQVLGITGAVSWYAVALLNLGVGDYVKESQTYFPAIAVTVCVPLVGAFIGLAWPRTEEK